MSHSIDTNSIQGTILSAVFVFIGEFAGALGSLDLQEVSYVVAITVGFDTIMGSPVKRTMGKFWKKLIDGNR